MKYKIIDIHPEDAFYNTENLIGKTIITKTKPRESGEKAPWVFVSSCEIPELKFKGTCFYAVKLKAVRTYTKKEKVSASQESKS